jgi:hypothetical protein
VVIKQSSSRQVDALIADLRSDRAVAREAAAARLAVIGARAVARVAEVARDPSSSTAARVAALGTLEAVEDPHGADVALLLATDRDPEVAVAAMRAMRPHLRGTQGVRVLECLTTVALDIGRLDDERVTAVQVLRGLDPATVQPLLDRLREDPSPVVAALATPATGAGRRRSPRAASDATGPAASDMLQGPLSDDPERLRHQLSAEGATAPLPVLQDLVARLREREATDAAGRSAWMTARAAAHLALASRGSRLALYDLRETLETSNGPLPVEFLAALERIGDASCLEPIASAYATAPAEGDWWREHLAHAFRAIATRERVTRRHAAMKKIARRWPEALLTLEAGG